MASRDLARRAKRPPKTPSVRLRRSDTGGPGIQRKRAGKGFTYVDADGDRVEDTEVRLLDRGFFRIGSEDYAVENETYGLATMRKAHVSLRDGFIVFDYPAKHGKRRVQSVVDPEIAVVVEQLKRRRGGGEELLA